MRLRPLHENELLDIAKRGSATVLTLLLFWGITAPAIFFDKPGDGIVVYRYASVSTTIVLICCFRSSYRNLLTPDISHDERRIGFVLFWCLGSHCCEILWFVFFSTWHANRLSATKASSDSLQHLLCQMRPWTIGMYAFHENSALVTTTLDGWNMFVKVLFIALAWSKYNKKVHRELEFRQALFWFTIFSIFQVHTFVQNFLLWFRLGKDSVENGLDQCIVWSIHVSAILGSSTCAIFSYQLLFSQTNEDNCQIFHRRNLN